jgi:hypothetical protein
MLPRSFVVTWRLRLSLIDGPFNLQTLYDYRISLKLHATVQMIDILLTWLDTNRHVVVQKKIEEFGY